MAVFVILRLTRGIQFFNVPSSSNEPNLKTGSRIIGSSYVKPERLDFAYFKFSDSLEGYTIIKRLIGKPFDTLECKSGVFYVNGENLDQKINLRYQYKVSKHTYDEYLKEHKDNVESYYYYDSDSINVFIDQSLVSSLPIKLNRYIPQMNNSLTPDIQSLDSSASWNDFGPLIIPSDKYFFLGDSRDNSVDSRYRGFVDRQHILGTLIFQF